MKQIVNKKGNWKRKMTIIFMREKNDLRIIMG